MTDNETVTIEMPLTATQSPTTEVKVDEQTPEQQQEVSGEMVAIKDGSVLISSPDAPGQEKEEKC